MSNSSPSNSIWPSNGIIGSEQIQIPDGINAKWPEGDVLVGNFVYKEGKLVGFVDCKSLVINDSKTTVIPYDYANVDFPNILKDTMTITGGERCKNLIVNCLEDAAVYITPMLKEILGDAKFLTEFIKEENKLIVHTDRVDDETLVNVSKLLERVLPQNMVVERYNHRIDVDWRDYPLPRNFTQIAWIEGQDNDAIHTDFCPSSNTEVHFDFVHLSEIYWYTYGVIFGNGIMGQPDAFVLAMYNGNHMSFDFGGQRYDGSASPTSNERHYLKINRHEILIDDVLVGVPHEVAEFKSTERMGIFTANTKELRGGHFQIYEGKFLDEGVLHCHFLPALDETGAPCLFDIVGRVTYYNKGTGDFLYPTDAAPAAAIGMDDKFYAKLTEHGVRRLYKVPDGCNMTKDEYAAANGFKEIVEPPMPQTGYWMPEWRETDTQIACEWIETEPPTEIES